jgi:hypothetical protein
LSLLFAHFRGSRCDGDHTPRPGLSPRQSRKQVFAKQSVAAAGKSPRLSGSGSILATGEFQASIASFVTSEDLIGQHHFVTHWPSLHRAPDPWRVRRPLRVGSDRDGDAMNDFDGAKALADIDNVDR